MFRMTRLSGEVETQCFQWLDLAHGSWTFRMTRLSGEVETAYYCCRRTEGRAFRMTRLSGEVETRRRGRWRRRRREMFRMTRLSGEVETGLVQGTSFGLLRVPDDSLIRGS